MIRRKTTKKERMNKAATATDVSNTTAVVHRSSSCSSIRSTNSVRFMEDTHTDDPLQRSAWKPTTSSHASIAPPVFINRRSSLDFNNNFIEHADENDNVDDKYDANSNDNNGSGNVNVNDKGDCINIHNDSNQKTKSKKPLSLLRSIIKKGRNYHHGNKIIEKGSNNINNKRWTSMTTLTTASCSSPSRANSSPIKPPTYASRKSSLDFNKNFLDHKDIIQQQQHGNTNGSNSTISIEKGSSNANNNNNERWTPTTTNSSSSSSSSSRTSSIAVALSSQLPPTFARRRSSLDFNSNFIDRKDSMITHKNNNRKKSKNNLSRSSIYNKKGGREGEGKNHRHDNDNTNTNNIEEEIIVNESGDNNNNNDNDNDNQRWTPMSTTTTTSSSSSSSSSKASSIVASSSILPPTFVNRRSSLDFNNNFIDKDCFYIAK